MDADSQHTHTHTKMIIIINKQPENIPAGSGKS